MSNKSRYTLDEHVGDSVTPRVRFAHFLAAPFIAVLMGISRVTRTEMTVGFASQGHANAADKERNAFLTMGAMFAKYSDDVIEIAEDDDDRKPAGYLAPPIHAACMRASAVARRMEAVMDFIKETGAGIGDGKPRSARCEYETGDEKGNK